MRFFWKLLLVAIPAGISGYLLYKKSNNRSSGAGGEQPGENKTTSRSSPESDAEARKSGVKSKRQSEPSTKAKEEEKEVPDEQIIQQLTKIEGVTSRVAENLVERGIKSREALMKLSEEELRSIRGIGPKRAAKILNLE